MNKIIWILLGILVAGIVATVGATAFMGKGMVSSTDRTAIDQAIVDNDYATWKSFMEKQITPDNFKTLVTEYNNRKQGQAAEQAVRDSITAGDYDAYVKATQAITTAKTLTESDFDTLVELSKSRNSTALPDRMTDFRGFGRGHEGFLMG
jgi:hypothetical protein